MCNGSESWREKDNSKHCLNDKEECRKDYREEKRKRKNKGKNILLGEIV